MMRMVRKRRGSESSVSLDNVDLSTDSNEANRKEAKDIANSGNEL